MASVLLLALWAVWTGVTSAGTLYAGGTFSTAGGNAANNVAAWNGTAWAALADGVNGTVTALTVYEGNLIAGGYFNSAGGVAVSNIAQWDGAAWSALGAGVGDAESAVIALAVHDGSLLVGGAFASAGGVAAWNIARWDGKEWSAMGRELDTVTNICVYNGSVYVAGVSVARWDGTVWVVVAPSAYSDPTSRLAVYGNQLYGTGIRLIIGPILYPYPYIARYNGGQSWSAVALVLGMALSLVELDGALYAGGIFDNINDIEGGYGNIARYDSQGNVWSKLASGTNGDIMRLAVFNGSVLACGRFTQVGGITANRVARWDGTSWTTFGPGMNGPVNAVASISITDGHGTDGRATD